MDSKLRKHRHKRVRAKISGTAKRPRVSVFRSARYISVQLIDDIKGNTLLSVKESEISAKDKKDRAMLIGEEAAKQAIAKGVKKAVFDCSGYKYHGRVKAVAEGLRKGGLKI